MKQATLKIFVLVFTLLIGSPNFATVILPAQLEDMVENSDIIADAACTAKRGSMLVHPVTKQEVPIVIYTFLTRECLKGSCGSSFEVSQWDVHSRSEAMQYHLPPIESNRFEVRQEGIFFFGPPSTKYEGFRWIVGGGQGNFKILRDAEGNVKVVNPYGNKGLFKGLPTKSLSKSQRNMVEGASGPISYDDFTSLIKNIVVNR